VQRKLTLPVAAALANAGHRRSELEDLLGTVSSESDVVHVARVIEECGGLTSVFDLADDHLRMALDNLRAADLLAGPRAQLEAIARFVTARDR
jgi:geranylgeranyl pyrophosphate synthase